MNIEDASVWLFAGVFSVFLSGVVRVSFLRASKAAAVDHYYWILAARAYREMSGFPVRIHNKFILEDERQAYPPGFGLFLAAFPETFISSRWSSLLVLAVDLVTLALVFVAGALLGIGAQGLVAITLVYGMAPVLASYNTQLTSRGLGNLFLVVSLLAQVAAASSGDASVPLALLGACALAAVVITHKMTTQFFAFLWLLWSFSLASIGSWGVWIGMLTPLAAVALATIATGPRFQLLQWRAADRADRPVFATPLSLSTVAARQRELLLDRIQARCGAYGEEIDANHWSPILRIASPTATAACSDLSWR